MGSRKRSKKRSRSDESDENEANDEILGRSLKSIALFAGPFRAYG